MHRELVRAIAVVALFCPATGWPGVCMGTIHKSQGSAQVIDDEKVIAVVKTGQEFLVEPRSSEAGNGMCHVYLKSGLDGYVPRKQIRLLPDEPLMMLNFDGDKAKWRKWQFQTGALGEQASAAKGRRINYYKILTQAGNGELKAMAKFFSLYRFMDGGAAEGYYPDTWELLHVVGDNTFARFLRGQSAKTRERICGTFSSPADTEPISHPKPYIKRHFPKTYTVLYGRL